MKNKYSFLDKTLHRLSLNNEIFKEICFDLESTIYGPKIKNINPSIFFVNGLARSGTTALLNHLVNLKVGKSLTYKDLPFIFLPNLLRSFKQAKSSSALVERAHGDHIKINEDSPEAIDEIFWKFQLKEAYIKEQALEISEINKRDVENYITFIRLHLLSSNDTIYLTKNNNSLLRIKSILKYKDFPANFIFTIRDPLSHANSLLKQHLRFLELHENDSFALTYFNTLGHFEFGKNLKYFDFKQEKYISQLKKLNPLEINYWLVTWLNYYTYLDQIRTNDFAFVCFSSLCEKPEEIIKKLSETFQFQYSQQNIESFTPPTYQATANISTELLEECTTLYQKLKELCI